MQARADNIDIDVEAHVLLLLRSILIGADRAGHDEIMHEDSIGFGRLVDGDIAAPEQAPIDAAAVGGLLRAAAVGNKIADHRHGFGVERGLALGASAEGAAKTQIVRAQRQKARNVRRLERAGEAGREPSSRSDRRNRPVPRRPYDRAAGPPP